LHLNKLRSALNNKPTNKIHPIKAPHTIKRQDKGDKKKYMLKTCKSNFGGKTGKKMVIYSSRP
jgi:hypothetical protein